MTAAGRLAGSQPLRRWLAAVVDRVGDQVLERVGQPVQDVLVQLHLTAGELQDNLLAGLSRHVAHQPRQGGEDPADWDHGQRHGAVADVHHPPGVGFGDFAQRGGDRGDLLSRLAHVQQGRLHRGRQSQVSPSRCAAQGNRRPGVRGAEPPQLVGGLLQSASAELSLAHGVQQVVDLCRRHPDGVGGGPGRPGPGRFRRGRFRRGRFRRGRGLMVARRRDSRQRRASRRRLGCGGFRRGGFGCGLAGQDGGKCRHHPVNCQLVSGLPGARHVGRHAVARAQ